MILAAIAETAAFFGPDDFSEFSGVFDIVHVALAGRHPFVGKSMVFTHLPAAVEPGEAAVAVEELAIGEEHADVANPE